MQSRDCGGTECVESEGWTSGDEGIDKVEGARLFVVSGLHARDSSCTRPTLEWRKAEL